MTPAELRRRVPRPEFRPALASRTPVGLGVASGTPMMRAAGTPTGRPPSTPMPGLGARAAAATGTPGFFPSPSTPRDAFNRASMTPVPFTPGVLISPGGGHIAAGGARTA